MSCTHRGVRRLGAVGVAASLALTGLLRAQEPTVMVVTNYAHLVVDDGGYSISTNATKGKFYNPYTKTMQDPVILSEKVLVGIAMEYMKERNIPASSAKIVLGSGGFSWYKDQPADTIVLDLTRKGYPPNLIELYVDSKTNIINVDRTN